MHIDIHRRMVPESCMGIEAAGDDGRTDGITTVRNPEGKLCTVADIVLTRWQ